MDTPAESKVPRIHSPIPHETVEKNPAAEQPTAEHLKIVSLDHVFPEKFGSYRVLKLLGKGGMGSVFLAEDPMLGRRVAIKTLRPELAADERSKERFLREGRICSAIKHEHIVTIYSVGEESGIPYLAMEYLEGYSLEDIIQKKKKLNWIQIIRLGREIARALTVAHAHKLIHRDIKPANIWLETIDKKSGKTRVKILDFGLARYLHQEGGPTQAGMVVGTPHYVSPEQARGKDLDSRSDLFSLGVVLYRLSTKKFPFDGDDTLALLTALAVDNPQPMCEHAPDVPPGLDAIVLNLLEKSPECRPASAQILADKLNDLYHKMMEKSGDATNSGPLPAQSTSSPLLEQGKTSVAQPKPFHHLIIGLCAMIALFSVMLISLLFYKILRN